MPKLYKWLLIGLGLYLVYAMLTTKPESMVSRRGDLVGRLLLKTDMLRDVQGNDPLEEKLKDNSLDSWLAASLVRSAALVLKASGEEPDSVACRRSLKYIRAASIVDSLGSTEDQLLSWVLSRQGDPQAAVIAAERAVDRQAPADTTPSLAWLGSLYLEAGQTDSALACFRRQLGRDPESEHYYNDTRYYLEQAGLPADTLEAVLSVSRIHTSLVKRARRAWRDFLTWPRRKLAALWHGKA